MNFITMNHSSSPNKLYLKRRNAGFTLIELLVVSHESLAAELAGFGAQGTHQAARDEPAWWSQVEDGRIADCRP